MKIHRYFILNKFIPLFLFLLLYFVSSSFAQPTKFENEDSQFYSSEVKFSGKLFIPNGEGKFPAVVILHGGSSNIKAHRSTSSYYARRFADNGIAALIYDKRGTGDSGGKVFESTFDDYVNDVISAAKYLQKHSKINPEKIGVFGPSQGGRIAALAAARNQKIAFIATMAAPLVSIADLCYFSSMDFLKRMGITGSVKKVVEPLWKKHYAFVENGDNDALKELDFEIEQKYSEVDTVFLPLKSEKLTHLKDFKMGDFQPMYNSMQNDYVSEIEKVKVPWLCIYAEFDQAVPVEASIKILKEQMAIGGNKNCKIEIIPNVSHGFRDVKTKKYFPIENKIIDWILSL